MPGMGQQRRRQRRLDTAQANRRIYDPRRWHKKSSSTSSTSTKNVTTGGQPPAGWMLMWAGRFKRWRRRWFVAHPPGLLLHYKNAGQIGRPGCISLLGATASPTPGKERQMKIVRGSMVYYLRTINKDDRQAWLDAIHESMRIYNKSVQKAAVGAMPGRSLLPQQSVPENFKEEWEAQERELNRRLAGRMQDLEPSSQAFLRQLQSLQQSLSVISGALGFSEKPGTASASGGEVTRVDNSVQSEERVESHAVSRSAVGSSAAKAGPPLLRRLSTEIVGSDFPQKEKKSVLATSLSLPESSFLRTQRSIFKWKGDGENKLGQSKEDDGEESDTFPSADLEENPDGSSDGESGTQQKFSKGEEVKSSVEGSGTQLGRPGLSLAEKRTFSSPPAIPSTFVEKSGPVIKGPLHAAWHLMQEAFAETLKGEIHRILELEAENAMLQESLASLPQLQKDHTDLLSLRASLQSSGNFDEIKKKVARNRDGGDGYDAEGQDSDDEITIVHSDLADEEYFEALEVLNQHDFIAKSSTTEDQEGYSEREDDSPEPPEEGDVAVDSELLSEAEGDEIEQPRTRLPAPRPLSRGFSLWTVLKNAIGKDLNHITMPATINEPLSVLQKCAEEMQYRYIIERAAEEESSIMRLLHVSTFACASYHGSIYRDAKPFNPLLGETYELLAPDEKSWFLTEQVSHHPPILAFHSESSVGDCVIYGEMEIKNKFWGKSVEVLPTGVCHLRYRKYGDHFTWSKVTTCAHNVVVGKLWLDNYGELVVKNHTTGDVSRIRFHRAGSKEQCRISGKVYNGKGVHQFSIDGNYQEKICATREGPIVDGAKKEMTLWKSPKRIEDFQQQYCFSKFSIGLNELTPKLAEVLPPNDSRFRPDERALEDGDLEKATPEKLRLEEKQRDARKLRNQKGESWQTLWFQERVPGVSQVKTGDSGEEPSWVYKGEYWEAREKQAWQRCPDIM